ncbi:MAG TPA: hypothetical protein VFE13_09380, partial [Caulobacteraceae bacterium]|nr:hypothetical protein [Caulobacteraceae bacterium]
SLRSNGDLTVTGTLAGAGVLQIGGGVARIAGATLALANTMIGGAAVTLAGAIANLGKITATSAQLLVGSAGASLTGGGILTLTSLATNRLSGKTAGATLTNVDNLIHGGGQLGGGQMTLVNQAAGRIFGDVAVGLVIDTGATQIQNAGTIAAKVGGGVEIRSAVDNAGLLVAGAGTLTLDAAVTGAGAAEIYGGGTLLAQDLFTQNVAFFGVGDTLSLAHSQTYAGKLRGFEGTDALDLRDIGFVSAGEATFSGNHAGGTLTITDGAHTATFKLFGDYTGVTFVAESDGQGGTLVSEGAAPLAVHRLVGAAAATSSPADGGSSSGQAPPRPEPVPIAFGQAGGRAA